MSVVIAISLSGAAGVPSSSADSRAQADGSRVSAPESAAERSERAVDAVARSQVGRACSARKAVRFYSRRVNEWRAKMGTETDTPPRAGHCPHYLAHALQRKAAALRKAYTAWWRYQYRWDLWLPARWYRIARCETGVRWDWNSGAYQGAFGFATSSWDRFRLAGYPTEAYLATPRQQYEVALAIWRRYGFSGWGCRNA